MKTENNDIDFTREVLNLHKDSKWANQIISLQEEDGKWGWFHSLSQFYDSQITTEQALRRLMYLGYTIEDECIRKAVSYMNDCLTGKNEIPDRREKLHDWNVFTSLILSAWIRVFTKDNPAANKVAGQWAEIISAAFTDGKYEHDKYVNAYCEVLGLKPKGGRLIDFTNFYPITLLADCLDENTEKAFIEHILNREKGIYYIYDRKIIIPPQEFESKTASHYLAAAELLAKYKTSKVKLQFVLDWLEANKNQNGKWDMGSAVNDKVYFPLSDDWRKRETREADCTERIINLRRALALS
ncbi:hypothetical protein EDD76_10919 [Kineothrix alysoides]|uniref:Prenyltransferase/squalene oxidase-like repeat protein n=1 Tax=Kineothrix alysoides TaxID=1469948 RepID=A0A4R1QUH6_9FIRM|nr:hypothetical protein EDD76_10919 [Kineothrix alysoides]